MTNSYLLLLPNALLQTVLNHARSELPNECCGFLAGTFEDTDNGKVGRVVQRYPLVNELASPVEFLSESHSLFKAHRAMDRDGLELLAIYHSHPTSAPIPSKKDRERNYSEDVMNLILGMTSDPPLLRGWWLTADDQTEAIVEVQPGEPKPE